MGWDCGTGCASRAEVEAMVQRDHVGAGFAVVEKARGKEGVTWLVFQGPDDHRIIVCLIVRKIEGTWCYRSCTEKASPLYFDCPMRFLAMVPAATCEVWRRRVKGYWARMDAQRVHPAYDAYWANSISASVLASYAAMRGKEA